MANNIEPTDLRKPWTTLDARLALANYRLFGDTEQLAIARSLAYMAGCCCHQLDTADGQIVVPALVAAEASLYRRWVLGRVHAVAEELEYASWNLPCMCDDSVGYQCSNHVETSRLCDFIKPAARTVIAQLKKSKIKL